ncbi:cobalt-precorrin-5B (C(1))-methyltransferase, partial [Azospirillum brasilense]|uniref:cobalt-precorrin-5B (C(1))-methyltransferase n=1 Tax=Azospirillum brasilense TaxID=192 RepID=UPI001FFE66D6
MDEHSATENGVDGEEGNGDGKALRRGWTTGACATAAARAACGALFSGDFPDPVTVTLP